MTTITTRQGKGSELTVEELDGNFTNLNTDKLESTDVATVALTGSYSDLTGTPTIPTALTDLGISDGTSGQVLSTDGAGTFTFITGGGGTPGADGADGADGVGVPAGGTTGQVLAKIDGTDYNTEWVDAASGGGSFDGDLAGSVLTDSTGTLTIASGNGDSVKITANNDNGATAANSSSVNGIRFGTSGSSDQYDLSQTLRTAAIRNRQVVDTTNNEHTNNVRRSAMSSEAVMKGDNYGTSASDRIIGFVGQASVAGDWNNFSPFTNIGINALTYNTNGTVNWAVANAGINISQNTGNGAQLDKAVNFQSLNYAVGSIINNAYNFVASNQIVGGGQYGDIYGLYIPGENGSGVDDFSGSAGFGFAPSGGLQGNAYAIYNNCDDSQSRLGAIREVHESYKTVTHTGGAQDLDGRRTCQQLTLQADISELTISGYTNNSNRLVTITIIFIQDNTGGRTVTWPAGTKFAGGVAEVDTTPDSKTFASVIIHGGSYYVTLATFE